MKEVKNENKRSQLIFEPRITRKLLKMNGELKFCPFCGAELSKNCECHKNIVVDYKPKRGTEDGSVPVFANLESFKNDFNALMEEERAKREALKEEAEPLSMDLD